MKRLVDYHLRIWKDDPHRKALILRGARQVGKTYAVRELGKTFGHYVEINLEERKDLHALFELNLSPDRILRELSVHLEVPFIPGETLLFFDEIQALPAAIIALRYFYEKMPELHVIAAGSLLEFAIREVGMPVGRIESLYVYPLSFIEFLAALGKTRLLEEILMHELDQEMSPVIHADALRLVGEYLALGGMPRIVSCWKNIKDPLRCSKEQSTIVTHYREDFSAYAKKKQIAYLELIFKEVPRQLGSPFRYSEIEGGFRKRELAPALDLLELAGIAHKVYHSSGYNKPLGAQKDPMDYKAIFLDVGLSQEVLNLSLANWFTAPVAEFANKGALTEAFVGQEILAYLSPYRSWDLYYWRRKERSSSAEIDYLIERNGLVIPVEVKGGATGRLKSLHEFLAAHPDTPYGLRFSAHNYTRQEKLHTYPLYAIAKVIAESSEEVRRSVEALLS